MKVLWFAIIPEHCQGPSGPAGNNTKDQDTRAVAGAGAVRALSASFYSWLTLVKTEKTIITKKNPFDLKICSITHTHTSNSLE